MTNTHDIKQLFNANVALELDHPPSLLAMCFAKYGHSQSLPGDWARTTRFLRKIPTFHSKGLLGPVESNAPTGAVADVIAAFDSCCRCCSRCCCFALPVR